MDPGDERREERNESYELDRKKQEGERRRTEADDTSKNGGSYEKVVEIRKNNTSVTKFAGSTEDLAGGEKTFLLRFEPRTHTTRARWEGRLPNT